MKSKSALFHNGLICLLLLFTPMLARGVILEQDGLEIRIRELTREMKGVLSFDFFCRNRNDSNKTITGTILVYNTDGSSKLADALVFLEINKNSSASEHFHAFLPVNENPGRWELVIDEIYDFTLADLEAGLSAEGESATGENITTTSASSATESGPDISGEWTFSGDPRWNWIFSASGSLKIVQQQDEGMLLMPDAFGTYTLQNGILTITYDDLCEWPDRFEVLGLMLVAGEYVLKPSQQPPA